MLGKLMKYEFRNTRKIMGLLYIIMFIATIVGCVSLHQLDSSVEGLAQAIWITLFILYFVAVMVVATVSFIYLCSHYFKTMYSDQGYLTHTLPISSTTIFSAKLLSAFIWMLITIVLCVLSVFCLIWFLMGKELLIALSNVDWLMFATELEKFTGFNVPCFVAVVFISSLLFCVYYLLFVYTSMAIGQLSGQNKVGISFLAGFILYVIIQICGFICEYISGISRFMYILSATNYDSMYVRNYILLSLAGVALLVTVLYIICIFINKKHVNLD